MNASQTSTSSSLTRTNVVATVVARNGVEVGQAVVTTCGRRGLVRWVRSNGTETVAGVRSCAAACNVTVRVVAS